MKPTLARSVYVLQFLLLQAAYAVLWPFMRRGEAIGVVVGPEEIASCLTNIGGAVESAVTVSLFDNPFYETVYDHDLARLRHLKWLAAPCLLAYLTHKHRVFVYVGGNGFLRAQQDGRAAEFKFLRDRGKTVVCYFTGSEIRSPRLLDAYGQDQGMDVLTTYQKYTSPGLESDRAEDHRRALAAAADRYADVVFSAQVDQMSYLRREPEPFLYFYPTELIARVPEKWVSPERIVVVHGPSSPVIKGTPLVRAAIKRLKSQGYDFEYVELIGKPHREVLACLRRAHVVLNEFYAFVPGIFGVEAMAANAVLLTSADKSHEPTLFDGANEAWVVTPYWLVYDRLREVLDRPERLQAQADRGTDWVARYCSGDFSARYLADRINV